MLNQPGYGQIKRADMSINISVSPRSNRILLNKTSPRRLRAKYTHRTNFVYAMGVFRPAGSRTANRQISS